MNRFEFRLARVRDYRRRQMEEAEELLRRLVAEKAAIQAAREELGRAYLAEETALKTSPTVQPNDFAALSLYRRHVLREQSRLARKIDEAGRKVEKQRLLVMEAGRRYRLLEKLHDKRRAQWDADFAREVDALAEESFLARWRPSPPGSSA